MASAVAVVASAQAEVAVPVGGPGTTHAVLAVPTPAVVVAPVAVFAAPVRPSRCLCSATIEIEFIIKIFMYTYRHFSLNFVVICNANMSM